MTFCPSIYPTDLKEIGCNSWIRIIWLRIGTGRWFWTFRHPSVWHMFSPIAVP
jgi:hypothetical protein